MHKPVILRQLASQDARDAVLYYTREASDAVALGFVDALEAGYRHISRHPSSGSPRYAHELNLPGLRSWLLSGYPYLIFYIEAADHIDVWRLLHSQQDIPAWLQARSSD